MIQVALLRKEVLRSFPKCDIDPLFSLIYEFSINPLRELYGRALWCELNPKKMAKKYLVSDPSETVTRCYITFCGIMSALYGPTFITNMSYTHKIDDLFSIPLTHSHSFHSFGIKLRIVSFQYGNTSKEYPGHGLVVIKYLNKLNEIRFRTFQSYILKYSLREYIEKGENDFCEDEFREFAKGLVDFANTSVITQAQKDFHLKYFGDPLRSLQIGFSTKTPIGLKVMHREHTLSEVIHLQKEYEVFKKQAWFPKSFIKP